MGNGLSSASLLGRGVRQECSLSPLLYLLYDKTMIIEVMDNADVGISVGGRVVNIIRQADDNLVVANSQKGLQQLMDNFNSYTEI